jgi:hypothetical protein
MIISEKIRLSAERKTLKTIKPLKSIDKYYVGDMEDLYHACAEIGYTSQYKGDPGWMLAFTVHEAFPNGGPIGSCLFFARFGYESSSRVKMHKHIETMVTKDWKIYSPPS